MNPANLRAGKSRHVLMIHTDGNTFNNPTLKCMIDLMLDNGYSIDLRYPRTFAPMPEVKGVRYLPYGKVVRRLKRIVFDRLCLGLLMYMGVALEKILYYREYDLVIGIDRQGLLEADIIARSRGIPFIFISFEITFAKETSPRYKMPEKRASAGAACWIIQDDERAAQLKLENGFSDANKLLLPLASKGVGTTAETRMRDKLGIPVDKKVAIVIGSVSSWSMTREIIRSVTDWPDEWVLILHERYGRTRELLADELEGLAPLIRERIYISNYASILVDEMAEILSGIDAGLAFYKPDYKGGPLTGDNLKFLGLASGKISTYLRYGVPVIVNQIGLFAEQVQAYNLGSVVSAPDQIENVLPDLAQGGYSDDIEHYFSSKLDFNVYADEVLSRIESVIAHD